MNEFGRVYGEALFDLASEEGKDAQILQEIQAVDSILSTERSYVKLISTQSLSVTERLTMLDEAFGSQVDAYLLNFMKILCERGAFDQIHSCRQEYEKLYHEKHGILPVDVTSAVPLTESQQQQLIAALSASTGKQIELRCKVDPQLRGGIRCEMAGKRLDNTIETRMDLLRRALSKKS